MTKSHLEQQNFKIMKDLQKKNQEQMRDISTQLQTDLQAFLQQSMEQMFNRMAPPQTAPPPSPASTTPHIVSSTPVSALPPTAKPEEPMGSAPSHAPPEVKKGVSGVKGSSAIATQSIHAAASNIQVPTFIPLSQPSQRLLCLGFNPLFRPWNKKSVELTLQPHLSWLQILQKKTLTQRNKRFLLTFPSES